MNKTTMVVAMKNMFSQQIQEKHEKILEYKARKEKLQQLLQDKTLPYASYRSYEMELDAVEDTLRFLDWDMKSWMQARSSVYEVMGNLGCPITMQIHPNMIAS